MGLPPWFSDKGDRQRQNKRSKKQEKDRAAEIGGRPTAGSGSSWRSPGDVSTADVLEELKYTDAASFSLKVADIRAIERKATLQGKEPHLLVEFMQHGLRVKITIE